MLIQKLTLFMVLVQTYGRVVQQFEQPQVMVTQGILQGKRYQTEFGNIFHTYAGIPYAQPPIGNLRLQDPLPPEGWEGIRDASSNPPKCPQLENKKVVGREDCLYLNVYTPEAQAPKGGHAVMVFIHGGDFMTGSIDDYSPLPLMDYGVVLVVMQYRLGVLGFLSTEDSTLPGNYGLKDQTLALKWVKDNIRDFGGDPNKVTIFGQGSGAYSAHYQVLSPYAKGLFSRAILQSGTALCPKYPLEGHARVARRVGQEVGCGGGGRFPQRNLGSEDLLQCLRQKDVEQLVPVFEVFEVWNGLPFSMTPRVDGDYLPEDPTLLVAAGNFSKVDVIIGMTSEEGGLMTSALYSNPHHLRELSQEFPEVGPVSLAFQGEELEEHLAAINYVYYLDNITKPITWEDADNITKMFTDRYVSVCSDFAAFLHARAGVHVRMYQLTHRGLASATDKFQILFDNHWVTQDDDLQYLFSRTHNFPPLRTQKDLRMRDIMLTLWTNFAKMGDPTPDGSLGFTWERVSETSLNYLELSPTTSMREDYRALLRGFWLSLPTRQNKFLFPEGIGHFHVRSFGDEDREDEVKMVFRPKGDDEGKKERPEGDREDFRPKGGDGGKEERPEGDRKDIRPKGGDGGEEKRPEGEGEDFRPKGGDEGKEERPGGGVGEGDREDFRPKGSDGGEGSRPGADDLEAKVEVLEESGTVVDDVQDLGMDKSGTKTLDASATNVKDVRKEVALDESSSTQTLDESGSVDDMEDLGLDKSGTKTLDASATNEKNVGEVSSLDEQMLEESESVVGVNVLRTRVVLDESGTKTLVVEDEGTKVALDESGAVAVEDSDTKVSLDESGAVLVENLRTTVALDESGSNVNIEGSETKAPLVDGSRTTVDVDESSRTTKDDVDSVTGETFDESGTKMEDQSTKNVAGKISESVVPDMSSEEAQKTEERKPEVEPKASVPKASVPSASVPKASEPIQEDLTTIKRVSGVTSKDSDSKIPEPSLTDEYTGNEDDLGLVVESLVPEIIEEDSDIVSDATLEAEVIANDQDNVIFNDIKRRDGDQKSEIITEDMKKTQSGEEREFTNKLEEESNAGIKDLSNADDVMDYVSKKEQDVHSLVSDGNRVDIDPSVDLESHSEYVDAAHMHAYDTVVQTEGIGIDTLSAGDVNTNVGVDGGDTNTKVVSDVGKDTDATDDMGIHTQAADNMGIHTQAADNMGIHTQAADNMGINTQAAENMGINTQAADNMGADTQAIDAFGTAQAADSFGTDTQPIGYVGTENPTMDLNINTQVSENVNNKIQEVNNIINDIPVANSISSDIFTATQRVNTIPLNLPEPDLSVFSGGAVRPKKLKKPSESDFFIVKKMVDYGDLHKILEENEALSRNYNAHNRVMSSMCDGDQC